MIAITVLAALLILQAVLLGGAKVVGTESMQERAVHVGFTAADYKRIGVLELLAAAGIGLGLAVPVIGVLAASGLLLLLGGALAAHQRAGDPPKVMAAPLVVAALVTAYLIALVYTH